MDQQKIIFLLGIHTQTQLVRGRWEASIEAAANWIFRGGSEHELPLEINP
jgi:hypothetical protein